MTADVLGPLTGIIAILSAVALPIGFGMYVSLRNVQTRHRERMELIKQGIIPPDSTKSSKPTPNKYRSLRNGFLCIGIALGFIIGLFVSWNMGLNEDQGVFVVASGVLLFLGLAYVSFYLMVKDKKEFNDDSE